MVIVMEENILRSRDTGIVSYAIVCRHDFEELDDFYDFIKENNLEIVSSRPAEKFYKGKLINRRLKYFDIEFIYTKPELENVRNSIALSPSIIIQECVMNPEYFDYVFSIAEKIGKTNKEACISMINSINTGICNFMNYRYSDISHKFGLIQKQMKGEQP